MKQIFKWCAVAALVAAAMAVVIYRSVNKTPSSDLPQYERVYAIFEDGGCLSCHSADPKLPFYAKLPVAGKIVMKDIDSGYRAYDMEKFMQDLKADGDFNPVDLAKIEKVVLDNRMPMAKYYLMHWGSQLTKEKRAVVLDWIAMTRETMYDDGLWHFSFSCSFSVSFFLFSSFSLLITKLYSILFQLFVKVFVSSEYSC